MSGEPIGAEMSVFPCPFCGHVDVEFSEVEMGTIAVDCPECQCIGPFADSHVQAARKWNTGGSMVSELTILRHENERLRIAEQDLARVRKLRAGDSVEIARLEQMLQAAGIER